MDDFSGHQELEKLKPRLEQALAAVKRKERERLVFSGFKLCKAGNFRRSVQ